MKKKPCDDTRDIALFTRDDPSRVLVSLHVQYVFYVTSPGLKLPQKSREKSLLPPAGLGRSEILAGRSEILAVAEARHDFPRKLSLYHLYLSPICLFPSYLYTILCPF